jgi:hypothetical protein
MTNRFVHEMTDVQVLEMTNHLMVMTSHKTLIHHYNFVAKNLENVHTLIKTDRLILFPRIFSYLDKEELITENLDNDFLYLNFLMMLH